ncbi:DUF3157 family protein [Photobacterium makurazakiensis]|uniref:DUF3157 family protein n=1 Tax=Photobacterium makurazakiensis TaxID=2910234 RepID=UPI003D0BD50F
MKRLNFMYLIKLVFTLLGVGLLATSVVAEPLKATLADGREVILYSDNTWRFLTPNAGTTASAAALSVVSSVPQPSFPTPDGILIEPGTGKQVEAAQRSGVTVMLEPAYYQNGELVIPTLLKNDGTDAIVLVKLALKLHSEKGEVMARKEKKVWTSIKRMPETYFRPDTEREGKVLDFSVPAAKHYYLELEITEVEHW